MEIQRENLSSNHLKLTLNNDGEEIARIFIYLIENELHDKPYAYFEDVFVKEKYRNQGNGKIIVKAAIAEAKKQGCYKIVCTSRYGRENVHKFYQNLGLKEHGKSFRIDFK